MTPDSITEMARRIVEEVCAANCIRSDGWVADCMRDAALAAIQQTTDTHIALAKAAYDRHNRGDGFDSQPARLAAWNVLTAIRETLKG